jgi:hypothetical protein
MKVVLTPTMVRDGAIVSVDGNIKNFNCSIYYLFSGKNIEYSKVPECSFSCEFFRHDHIGASQKEGEHPVEAGCCQEVRPANLYL